MMKFYLSACGQRGSVVIDNKEIRSFSLNVSVNSQRSTVSVVRYSAAVFASIANSCKEVTYDLFQEFLDSYFAFQTAAFQTNKPVVA